VYYLNDQNNNLSLEQQNAESPGVLICVEL
jgi:hypothetical protein